MGEPDVDEGEWDQLIAINLKSVFLGMKYAIPAIVASGGGRAKHETGSRSLPHASAATATSPMRRFTLHPASGVIT